MSILWLIIGHFWLFKDTDVKGYVQASIRRIKAFFSVSVLLILADIFIIGFIIKEVFYGR